MLDFTPAQRDASHRLLLATAVMGVVLMSVIGGYGLFVYRGTLAELAAERLQTSTDAVVGRIDEVLALSRHRLTALAARPDVGASLRAEDAPGGDGTAGPSRDVLADLAEDPSLESYLLHIALVDREGRVVRTAAPRIDDREIAAPHWIDDALATDYRLRTASSDAPDAAIVDMTVAVDHDADRLGVIWTRLDLGPILARAAERSGAGQALAATRNWRNDTVIIWPPSNANDGAGPETLRPTRIDRPIVLALRGDHAIRTDDMVDEHGMPVLAATRHLEALDWGIVQRQRFDDVLAPARELGRDLLVIALVLLGLALLVTHRFGHMSFALLQRLAGHAEIILKSLVDGVLIADKRGKILTANPAAAEIFGWEREDLIGRPVDDLMPPDLRDSHRQAMAARRREAPSTILGTVRELQGMKRDGTIFPIELALNELEVDRRTQFVAVLRDIGDRETARRQIAEQAAELNKINGQLERRNGDLQKQFETAHQFVDNVSHEFRTPLTVIKEYVQLLRDGALGALNDEQIEFADVVLQRSEDLNIMVNDMLDISRLNAGLLGISRRRYRFETIADRCRPVLENRAKAAGIDLQFALPDGLPEIFADPEKITRIIINLAVNACKFTDEGGQIRIWVRNDDRASQLIVGVTDNGPGIAPNDLKAIFERFRQVGDVRQSTKGFGLGLAITKELVDLSLGDISVESKPGEGSTFGFTIPTADPLPLLKRFLDRLRIFREGASDLALMSIDAPKPMDRALADRLNETILHALRSSDLCLRVAAGRWLIAAAMNQKDAGGLHYRLERDIDRLAAEPECADVKRSTVTSLGTWPLAKTHDALLVRFAEAMKTDAPSTRRLEAV